MLDSPIDPESPLGGLGTLASQQVEVAPGVSHHEMYTTGGLLSLLWYSPAEPKTPPGTAVVMGGGAMGGLLGGGGLYHQLGGELAAAGIPAVSIGWRRPNDLNTCTHDMLAAMQLISKTGPRKFVTIGHSFGGAIAIRAAASVPPDLVPGVVTLATQSGGCEPAESLGDREIILFHGDNDSILPLMTSETVRMLAGTGELVVLAGGDHLLAEHKDQIIERLLDWIPQVLQS